MEWDLPYLSDFLDLGAPLADEGAALAGWHHKPQCHWGFAGGGAVAHGVGYVLGREKHSMSALGT